jgi:predicted nucleic acid-binding Zn ribbon protein
MTLPRSDDPFICPVCGAEVPAKAVACPECGSDEKTGWSENTVYDATGIEDPDDFDYEAWKRREVSGARKRTRRDWLWWIVALTALLLFVLLMLR